MRLPRSAREDGSRRPSNACDAPRREHAAGGQAVLFDLDGTLIATKRLYLECYRRTLGPVLGREPSDEEVLALKPRSETRLLCGQVGPAALAACVEAFVGHYEALHDALFEGVYDGVPAMLEGLRGAGRAIGIVTGKSRRAWEITNARAPLGRFDVLVFDDEVDAPKPDPAGLRLALERLNIPADRALYVGDSMGDIFAANAAGIRPVAALWSKRNDEHAAFVARAQAEGALVLATPAEVVQTSGCGGLGDGR